MLNPHVFRAYDVRGLVGSDINPDVFRQVGRAYATMIRRHGGRRIAVGRDNRLSSNDLKVGFREGARPAGVAGLYGPELLRRIGCDVIELHCESDGTFPNHLPDPEDERNVEDLKIKVVEVGADVGVAYDGDADRVGIIDERGWRHEADLILILLARDLLTRHPGAKVVFDVKSSQALVDDIRQHGGVPVMWKTGHSHLKRKMRDDHILLRGEVSGHMFFAENYYGVDDGILASCKIIEMAARATEPLSRLFSSIP